jgi:hypothetical protein
MKKLYTLIFLLSSVNLCHAALFGVSAEYVKNKTTEFKNEMSAVRGDLSAVKGDVSGVKSNIGKLETRIGNIEAKATAQGAAVVGLKNDIQQTNSDVRAGGNISQTTNSDAVMKAMIASYEAMIGMCKATMLVLIVQLCALFAAMMKMYSDIFKTSEANESTMDDKQMALITKLAEERVRQNGDKNKLG